MTQYMDRLIVHFEDGFNNIKQGKLKKQLVERILFSGRRVNQVTYDHSRMLYRSAKTRYIAGDKFNAKLLLTSCAKNMGVI